MWLHLRIIALVALITIINYFDRSALSFAIQPIEQTLSLSNLQFGWIAAAWGIGYLIMSIFGGMLADRMGPIVIWPVCACLWSLVTMGMGLAQGFTSFFILRIILGIPEGMHFPCLLRTITDWLPPSFRARSLALGLLGVPVSSVIGALFISWLIEDFGWRAMFFVLGFLGLAWSILWVLYFRGKTPPSSQDIFVAGQNTVLQERKTPWKQLLSSHPFQISCFIYFAFGYTIFLR